MQQDTNKANLCEQLGVYGYDRLVIRLIRSLGDSLLIQSRNVWFIESEGAVIFVQMPNICIFTLQAAMPFMGSVDPQSIHAVGYVVACSLIGHINTLTMRLR